ncbi:MAG: DUF4058 family protein [Candidatus Promineifilaceae bacterium]
MQTIDERIEERALWESLHRHLIVEIFERLRDGLGHAYLVDFETTLYLVPRAGRHMRSVSADVDVTIVRPGSPAGAGAAATPTPALLEVDEAFDEFERFAIQVRRRDMPDPEDALGMQVVSVLELVSPSNKGSYGANDRRKFLTKRADYLASSLSYVEVDLRRSGQRELPQPMAQLETSPYMIWASRAQLAARHHWGWGWHESERIPTITLPLGFPNVFPLGVAACYANAYLDNQWPVRLDARA